MSTAWGGRNKTSIVASVKCYDPAVGTWTDMALMPRPRYGHAASAIGDKIYVTGGCFYSEETSDSVICYDTVANTWSSVKHMIYARHGHTSAAVGDKLVVINQDNGERYDPANDTWSMLSAFPNLAGCQVLEAIAL